MLDTFDQPPPSYDDGNQSNSYNNDNGYNDSFKKNFNNNRDRNNDFRRNNNRDGQHKPYNSNFRPRNDNRPRQFDRYNNNNRRNIGVRRDSNTDNQDINFNDNGNTYTFSDQNQNDNGGYRNDYNNDRRYNNNNNYRRDNYRNNNYQNKPNRRMFNNQVTDGPRHGKWDQDEVAKLKSAVESQVTNLGYSPNEVCVVESRVPFDFEASIKWEDVAKIVGTRNPIQCKNKYIDWTIQLPWDNEDERKLHEAWLDHSRDIIARVADDVFANEELVPEEMVDLALLRDRVNPKRSTGGIRAKLSVMCSKNAKDNGWRPALYKKSYPECLNCVLKKIQEKTKNLSNELNMMVHHLEMQENINENLTQKIDLYKQQITNFFKKFEDAKVNSTPIISEAYNDEYLDADEQGMPMNQIGDNNTSGIIGEMNPSADMMMVGQNEDKDFFSN